MVRTIFALGEFAGDEGTDVDHIQSVAISIFVQDCLGSLLAGCTRQVHDVSWRTVHGRSFMHVGCKATSRGVGTATSRKTNHDLDRLFRIISECRTAGEHCSRCESRSKSLGEFHRILP